MPPLSHEVAGHEQDLSAGAESPARGRGGCSELAARRCVEGAPAMAVVVTTSGGGCGGSSGDVIGRVPSRVARAPVDGSGVYSTIGDCGASDAGVWPPQHMAARHSPTVKAR